MPDFNTQPEPEPTIEVITPVHTLRPSMSQSERLLNCSWPWRRQVAVRQPTPEMLWGSAVHQCLAALLPSPPKKLDFAAVAKQWGIEDVVGLKQHALQASAMLLAWLRADNPWKFDFVKHGQARFEVAVAYNVKKKTARTATPPSLDTHVYAGISKDELPGTLDLIVEPTGGKKNVPDLLVIDHKTGFFCDLPLESAQLKSLVLASAIRVKAKRPAGAIFHTPQDTNEGGYIYADDFSKEILQQHAADLKEAWAGIGSGKLKPGEYCTDCPAMTSCPVWTSQLVALRDAKGRVLTKEKIGEIHQTLAFWNAFAEKVDKEIVRPWIRKHGFAVRPDGKIVDFVDRPAERLSKSKFIEVLGEAEAEKWFEKFRKMGVLKKEPGEQLRAQQDK